MPYNPNIHHCRSIRLREYDYSQGGLYFVTICVHNHECLFGEIVNEKMVFSPLGTIADIMWHEIKNHAQNIELQQFVVMPNHIHGIIEITNHCRGVACNARANAPTCTGVACTGVACTGVACNAPTDDKNEYMASISPKSGTLSTIIRSYKSAVSKHAHRLDFGFAWQRNYHEHIIRDRNEHARIAEYVENNPINWGIDRFYR